MAKKRAKRLTDRILVFYAVLWLVRAVGDVFLTEVWRSVDEKRRRDPREAMRAAVREAVEEVIRKDTGRRRFPGEDFDRREVSARQDPPGRNPIERRMLR